MLSALWCLLSDRFRYNNKINTFILALLPLSALGAVPTITSTEVTSVAEDSLYSYALTANDDDNDTLTWSVTTGTTLPAWLSLSQGGSTANTFGDPMPSSIGGVSSDADGNVYAVVADLGKVFRIQPDGTTSEFASVNISSASYGGLVVGDFLYITEYGASKVSRLDLTNPGAGVADFVAIPTPLGIVEKDGFLYVATYTNNTVEKIEIANPANITTFISGVSTPWGLGFSSTGEMYVTDWNSGTIKRYDTSQALDNSFTTITTAGFPADVKVDANDNLYVALYTGGSTGGVTKYLNNSFTPLVISSGNNPLSMSISATGTLRWGTYTPDSGTSDFYVRQLNTGAVLSGTPSNAEVGDYNVSVSVTDTTSNTVSQAFTITVTNTNDAPSFSTDVSLPAVAMNVTDPTGSSIDSLFASQFSDIDPVEASGGNGGYSFTGVAISDNTANSTTEGQWQYSLDGSTWVNIPVVASASSLLLSKTTQLRFIPVSNFSGTPGSLTAHPLDDSVSTTFTTGTQQTIDITAQDATTGVVGQTGQLISISVSSMNSDPTLTSIPSSIMVTEDTTSNVDLSAATFADADSGSNAVTFKITASAGTLFATAANSVTVSGSGTATLILSGTAANIDTFLNTSSNIQYLGVSNSTGINAATLTLIGNDGGNSGTGGGSDVSFGSVSVNISNVNDAPVISSTALTNVAEDSLYSYSVSATDIDVGDILTLSAPVLPNWLTFTPATGVLTGTPSNDHVGSHAVTIRVNDGTVNVDQSFTIAVSNTNDAPSISGTPKTSAVEGVAYSFSVTGSDIDTGDTLSYQMTNHPTWLSINSASGLVSGTPSSGDIGTTNNIIVSVSDGTVSTAMPAFSVTVDSDLDGDGIGDATDLDIDGDGMSNAYEIANGLDPRDPSDAIGDLDGDGINNLDEFTNDSDPTVDDYGPIITGESLVTINAVALLTDLPANLVSAADALDGPVSVTHNLESELLSPGRHVITWTAKDIRNNSTTFEQVLNIQPLANWQVNQVTGEGNTASITLYLNGPAPVYPVVANYTVSGTASNPGDHDAVSGTLIINSGQSGSVDVVIESDEISEGDETILFTLDSISNATKGIQRVHQMTISEVNHAPIVRLNAALNSAPAKSVTLLSTDDGLTTITANVSDANAGDSHSFVWSGVSNLAGTATANSYQFDPATAGVGVYQIAVIVTDDAASPLSGSALMTLKILDESPVLSALQDSDGDGIDDSTEGLGDSDGDNVPDFADSSAEENTLAMYPLGGKPVEGAWMLEAQSGMRLKLNVYSNRKGNYSPLLDESDVIDQNELDLSDDGYVYDGGVFDFVISNMPVVGETVFLVIPQLSPIPANAVYRKERNGRWSTFVEDDNNFITSAPGRLGTCPPPGSTDYQLGLNEGDYCVQIGIEDGGENDADGIANGTILDPGGVGQATPQTINSGGGGAINGTLLLLLLSVWLGRLAKRDTRQRLMRLLTSLLIMASSISQAQDGLADTLPNFYATAHIGKADSNVHVDELQAEFVSAGITNVTINTVDNRRRGYGLGLGYLFHPQWSVELGYLDLQQVDVNFTAISAVPDLGSVMPESGEGFTLSGVYRYPLSEYINARARAGLFNWDADYTTTSTGAKTTKVKDSGTDMYFGLGLDAKVNNHLTLTAEYQCFDFDRDNTDYFQLGIEWQLDYK